MRILVCIITLAVAASTVAFADDDKVNQEATQKTQDLLRDHKQRDDATKDGPGKQANDQLNALTKGNQQINDEVYGMAADLLPVLVKEANGDPKKMQEILEHYQRDPAGFAKSLPPEDQKKLHDLSQKLEHPDSTQH